MRSSNFKAYRFQQSLHRTVGASLNQFAAVVFLALIAFIPIVYGIYLLSKRGSYSIWESLLFAIVYYVCRTLWRVEVMVDPAFRQLRKQGVIFVANHRSSMDPFFIQIAAGRRVHWMVAGEYCRHALFGPVLRMFQVIPTNRGGVDTASTKQAIRLVSSGRWIGMFPEGRINRTEDPLVPIRPGAGLVGIKGDGVLVPVWIEGAPRAGSVWEPLLKTAHVRVHIGAPLPATASVNEEDAKEETDMEKARSWVLHAMQEVTKLGGYTNFEIAVAGRKWVEAGQ